MSEEGSIVFSIEPRKAERARAWVKHHPCKIRGKYQGAIGGAISYQFTDTSIGQMQSVNCSCGESLFLSDDL